MEKIGVVLMNMGGPDSLDAIRPFLYNLFSDHDIIRIPRPIQKPVAFLISHFRAKKTRKYYQIMGGKSPQKEQTIKQAQALSKELGSNYKVVVALRYWHPMTQEAVSELTKEGIREVILLPLYPQYSRTTTGSSFNEFDRVVRKYIERGKYFTLTTLKGQEKPYFYPIQTKVKKINCYYNHPLYIQAMVENIKKNVPGYENYFFLFTAHSLPISIIEEGDPYKKQVEETVRLIMESFPKVKHALGYQSKVGPTKWLGPFTDELLQEIISSGIKNIALIPVSFTCEHSETLYELDYLYGNLAKSLGVENFVRVPTLQDDPLFIKALAELVRTCC